MQFQLEGELEPGRNGHGSVEPLDKSSAKGGTEPHLLYDV
jgi:hypothetical protein